MGFLRIGNRQTPRILHQTTWRANLEDPNQLSEFRPQSWKISRSGAHEIEKAAKHRPRQPGALEFITNERLKNLKIYSVGRNRNFQHPIPLKSQKKLLHLDPNMKERKKCAHN